MNIKGTASVIALIAFILFAKPANATGYGAYGAYGSYGAYGAGTPVESILVDKLVATPTSQTKGGQLSYTYVDNLSSSDARFAPGQEIQFKIKVKNTSNRKLGPIRLEDTLPKTLEMVMGFGTTDFESLEPGQEREFTIKARVVAQDKLPADKSVICDTNKARAFEATKTKGGQIESTGVSDEDTAQFCIEKQITNVTSVPQAGPEAGLGLLALQFVGLGSGIYLKKRVN